MRPSIALGHALGMSVLAEGIETEAVLAWLREAGCDLGQGCFIARALDAQAFSTFIASRCTPP